MMRKITGVLIAVLIASSAIGWAAQYPLTVTAITIDGNDEIKNRDILEVVHFRIGDVIEEADLRTASQAIYDMGWFGEVTLDRDVLEEGRVALQVVENPVIQKIVITGNINRRDYSLLGVKLFDVPIMTSNQIRRVLRDHDIQKRKVLNPQALMTALEEVIAKYSDNGYVLVSIGDVDLSEILSIEFIELRFSGSLIEGLSTVPESIVEDMIEIPLDKPLQMADFQAAYMNLSQSVYFSNVEYEPQPGTEKDRFWLRWTFEERSLLSAPETISSIEIDGNTIYQDEELQELISELPNHPIDNFELLELVQDVYYRYSQDGYSMVKLSASSVEDGVLQLNVSEGVITQITVEGNTRTHDYVISRNSKLETGKVLNRKDLVVSYQKLTALGYFESVDIVPEWVDEGLEVTITVTEKSNLGGFAGSMALDPSTGTLFGELSLNRKNLFGTGQDLELSYSRGLIGTEDSNPSTWNLGYSTIAYFPGFDRVGFNLYQKHQEIEIGEVGAVNTTIGAGVSFSYPVADYSNFGLNFHHEEEDIADLARWISADVITLSLTFDNTNSPSFPTEGSRRQLSFEKAGGFSAGREYAKFDFTWIHFVPTTMPLVSATMNQTLGIRIKTGWGDNQLPTSRYMELGGPMSIRGISGVSTRQYVLANVEYRLELVEGLYATTFWDTGCDLSSVRLGDFLSSCGFEIGIRAMGMFVRLDLAWNMNEDFTWLPIFDFGFSQMF